MQFSTNQNVNTLNTWCNKAFDNEQEILQKFGIGRSFIQYAIR